MIKRSIHQEDTAIVNLYETNIGAPKYVRNREGSCAQGNPIQQCGERAAVVGRVRKKTKEVQEECLQRRVSACVLG